MFQKNSIWLHRCVACDLSLSQLFDQDSFPLCSLCNESLVSSPDLCQTCGGPVCAQQSNSLKTCLRPWIQHQGIHSYSARYLLIEPGYSVLKKWKLRRGLLFDQIVLKSNETILKRWREFEPDAIVPVPQFYKRAWDMGGSRTEMIAKWVSKETSCPLLSPLSFSQNLRQKKRQAQMNLVERLQSSIFFHLDSSQLQDHKKVILVDDFMTTGKTLNSAALTLLKGGVKQIHAFCLGVKASKLVQS